MRKQKFQKLLTIALPLYRYELVKEISDQYNISMGEVIRDSFEYSITYEGDWLAAKKGYSDGKHVKRQDDDLQDKKENNSEVNRPDSFNFDDVDF